MSATGKFEAVESTGAWRLSDRIGLAFCWFLGLLFCAIAAAIVIYMLIKGIQYAVFTAATATYQATYA